MIATPPISALRQRRALVAGLVGVLAVALVVVAVFLETGRGRKAAAPASSVSTYTIVRRTLEATETASGTLGFDSSQTTITDRLPGAISELPPEGSTIAIGAALYRVGGQPVVLLRGRGPASRKLEEGVSDGSDVRQLEANLRALGFDPYHQMRIDGHFDFATRAIVERWQRAIGMAANGIVDAGRIVFAPGPVRVGKVTATIGSGGGPVMTISATTPTVQVNLDTSLEPIVAAGDSVTIDLPDGRTVGGRITDVGRVATADSNASSGAVITVTVALDRAAAAGRLDQAPVSVHFVRERRRGALAVPVAALLARAGGGYAVEVVAADGTRAQVPVQVGLFASGYVEVSGAGIRPGVRVVVPGT